MKHLFAFIFAISLTQTVFAQNEQKGSVTVTQSSAISDIVNNSGKSQTTTKQQTQAKPTTPAKPATQTPAKPATQTPAKPATPVESTTPKPESSTEGGIEKPATGEGTTTPATSTPRPVTRPTQVHTYTAPKRPKMDADGNPDGEMLQTHGVDYRTPDAVKGPKIVKGAHKAAGWRIQIYNGGNKRKDRQEAERLAKLAKKKFPGMPIYVHFYSPRWMTKCGNFRTHKEAEPIKTEFINAGFKNASIVRQQIVVE